MMDFYFEWGTRMGRVQWRAAVDELAQRVQVLIRHLMTLDATVLGLLAALCETPSTTPLRLLLIGAGALLLFLSLASGMIYIWMDIISVGRRLDQSDKIIRGENIEKIEPPTLSDVLAPCAIICPISFFLGLLFLLGSIFL